MRCLVAIDSGKSDVIFIECDDDFTAFLLERTREIYEDDYTPSDLGYPDINIATHFFLPFCQIQNKQCQENNQVERVTCYDGMSLAFHRFDNIDVISLNSALHHKEADRGRCVIFEKLVKLHLGPATHFLKPDDLAIRHRLWSKIARYLNSWDDASGISEMFISCDNPDQFSELCKDHFKQHFLYQAVEELHINPELKRQSTVTVSDALQAAQKIDKSYCQAILAVNGKVLVSHSYRQAQKLDPSDLLFIMFIAHCSLPKSPIDIEYSDSFSDSNNMEYYQQNIFIRKSDQNDHFLPCTLTAVSIRPGIVLILLAETKTATAPNICRALDSLSHMYRQVDEMANEYDRSPDDIRIEMKELPVEFLRVKGVVDLYFARIQNDLDSIEHFDYFWGKIREEWRSVCDVSRSLGEENRYFHEFDRKLKNIISLLRTLFHDIYCRDIETEIHSDITDIYKNVSKSLRDLSSFLLVKAQRNFTLGNYLSDFPGIVHFLVINRTKNKIIVPSLGAEGDSAQYCHRIIHCLYRFYRKLVQNGFLSGFMRKKDLLYSYKLIFQVQGRSVAPESDKQYIPPPQARLLCHMYGDMVKHYFGARAPQVECLELLMIHIGEVPMGFVHDCSERLLQVVCSDFQ